MGCIIYSVETKSSRFSGDKKKFMLLTYPVISSKVGQTKMFRRILLVLAGALLGALAAAGIASAEVETLQGVMLTAETLPMLYPYLIGGGLLGGVVGLLLSFVPPILGR